MANGPVLIFSVVTLDRKSSLSRVDWLLMASLFLCLVTGFCVNITSSYEVGLFFLMVSISFSIPILYLPIYSMSVSTVYSVVDGEEEWSAIGTSQLRDSRFKLSLLMVALFALYPLTYFIAWGGGMGPPATIATFIFLTLLVKGLLATAIMSTHYNVLLTSRRAFQEIEDSIIRNNEARRTFLKYIFHEIRNPLNSLSIGIEILLASKRLTESEHESLTVMKEASGMITTTLNDVLCLQKIQEGNLFYQISLQLYI